MEGDETRLFLAAPLEAGKWHGRRGGKRGREKGQRKGETDLVETGVAEEFVALLDCGVREVAIVKEPRHEDLLVLAGEGDPFGSSTLCVVATTAAVERLLAGLHKEDGAFIVHLVRETRFGRGRVGLRRLMLLLLRR